MPPFKETRDYVSRVHGMAGQPIQLRNRTIYKTTEVVAGHDVPLYSDQKPAGDYQVVQR